MSVRCRMFYINARNLPIGCRGGVSSIMFDASPLKYEFVTKFLNVTPTPYTKGYCSHRNDVLVKKDDYSSRWSKVKGTKYGRLVGSHDLIHKKFDDEITVEEFDPNHNRPLTENPIKEHYYSKEILKFGKRGQIAEAIKIFDDEILKKNRLTPTCNTYGSLIYVLGRVGYFEKAFYYYNQMKRRSIYPKASTYASLLNGCANSPFRKESLKKIYRLRQELEEKNIPMTAKMYKLYMRALAKQGKVAEVFQVADEIKHNKIPIDFEVYNYLLMACSNDETSGLTEAILVWRRMRQKHFVPTTRQYNLLLRVIIKCKLGPPEVRQKLLHNNVAIGDKSTIPKRETTPTKAEEGLNTIEDIEKSPSNDLVSVTGSVIPAEEHMGKVSENVLFEINNANCGFNILNPRPHKNLIKIDEIENAYDRYIFIGGKSGFLGHMKKDGAAINSHTIGLLLQLLPKDANAENNFLDMLESLNVTPQLDHLNIIISRRALRREKEEARNMLNIITKYFYVPNQMTFNCLAMTCRNKEEAGELLDHMKEAKIPANHGIFNNLSCSCKFHFMHRMYILNRMKEFHVNPDEKMLLNNQLWLDRAKKIIVKQERAGEVSGLSTGYSLFKKFYTQWLKNHKVDLDEHPWTKYQPLPENESVVQAELEKRYKHRPAKTQVHYQ